MGFQCKSLSAVIVLIATIAFSSVAVAQTKTINYEETNDVFNRAYFQNDPDFYENQTFQRQVNWIIGPGSFFRNSFPESEIARDAELVNIVYRDVLTQQVSNDPYLRTPDLPNPYNTSLLASPQLNAHKLRMGTEFRFETSLPR
ncbi:hypothetical protein [Iningainema tapete]|uniref:Uncharacterized protein n=1 Tax=Iningainema tapete BLCC-T55 TaxID=2748662 RepID=A0A8J6XDM3_9CYAN|nr:hypothetical protein [Iningainema tapete]MBD2773409.1 hypothetical protein [Iningainema tapete BLCC-T55]